MGATPGSKVRKWSAPDASKIVGTIVSHSGAAMKARFLFGTLIALGALNSALGAERQVVIDLNAQRALILEQGTVELCAPIASGKDGRKTPTGHFRIISKDIDHHSGSFGSIVDATGRILNSNATPGTRVPRDGHYEPAPMPYFMEFAPMVGMHAGYLPGYPASHGCVRMPHDLAEKFYSLLAVGTPVTVIGHSSQASRVRAALPANGIPGERVVVVSQRAMRRAAWTNSLYRTPAAQNPPIIFGARTVSR